MLVIPRLIPDRLEKDYCIVHLFSSSVLHAVLVGVHDICIFMYLSASAKYTLTLVASFKVPMCFTFLNNVLAFPLFPFFVKKKKKLNGTVKPNTKSLGLLETTVAL